MATTKQEIIARQKEIQNQFSELQVEFNKLAGKLELLEEQEKTETK
jgi:hypothetical protein